MAEHRNPRGVDVAIAALHEERTELARLLRGVEEALRALVALGTATEKPTKKARKPRVKRTAPRLRLVADILRQAGRPLTAVEIRDLAQIKDPTVTWLQPGNVLRSLTRDQLEGPDKIIRPGIGLYALRETPSAAVAVTATVPAATESRTEQPSRGMGHHAVLVVILKEAGRSLHYKEIHAKMREHIPGLEWNFPAESVRQVVARSRGEIVRVGPGTWDLASRVQKEA